MAAIAGLGGEDNLAAFQLVEETCQQTARTLGTRWPQRLCFHLVAHVAVLRMPGPGKCCPSLAPGAFVTCVHICMYIRKYIPGDSSVVPFWL